MKRVLIHTLFYQNYNYGGILQAYALYHFLEGIGYQCEELNYSRSVDHTILKLIYRGFRIAEILKDPWYYITQQRNRRKEAQLHEQYVKYAGSDLLKEVFESFMEREFCSTKVYRPDSIRMFDGVYDYYITGGDQVWNPEWTDRNFFLCFGGAGKRIAFSCSAGKDHFTKDDRKKILKHIGKMDAVSVRERNFSELLDREEIVHELIADPVFLLTKQEWDKFACNSVKGDYLFAYLLGNSAACRKAVKAFACSNGLKIVSIPHISRMYVRADEGFADVEILDAGPGEFVGLIRNAKFILTDSFHGTAFSLILEKQFLSFRRSEFTDKRSMNARLFSVLEEYGLEERMVSLEQLACMKINDMPVIEYEAGRAVTQNKHRKAVQFLKKNMDAKI